MIFRKAMPSYVHQLEKNELDRLYLSLDNFLVRSDLIIRLKNIDGTNTLGKDFFPPSGVMRCSMQNWPSKMGFFFSIKYWQHLFSLAFVNTKPFLYFMDCKVTFFWIYLNNYQNEEPTLCIFQK